MTNVCLALTLSPDSEDAREEETRRRNEKKKHRIVVCGIFYPAAEEDIAR
jgi:hypothetical protein